MMNSLETTTEDYTETENSIWDYPIGPRPSPVERLVSNWGVSTSHKII